MSYILTCVASEPPLSDFFVNYAREILDRHDIHQTCTPIWLSPGKAIDFGLETWPSGNAMVELRKHADKEKVDLFVQGVDHRRKRLLICDMESTIIENEMLDELAVHADVEDKIAQITRLAMNGEIDFQGALRERVKLLQGLPASLLRDSISNIKINDGAKTMVKVMSQNRCHCVLVSGGFTFYSGYIASQVGFHNHHANELGIKNQELTGNVLDPILDRDSKLDLLKEYMEDLILKPADVLAVGDGANDLAMLKYAGLGVGYRPKEIVANEIYSALKHGDFTALLYAQGYDDMAIKKFS